MTEMFGEAWPPMSVPDLAPDDDDDILLHSSDLNCNFEKYQVVLCCVKACYRYTPSFIPPPITDKQCCSCWYSTNAPKSVAMQCCCM